MDAPICSFVEGYLKTNRLRLHMPGHKGAEIVGMEARDITEIPGADSLYEASGIIQQSEANCSRLFGCHSYYSTEGSSLCIRAMLYLCLLYAKATGKTPVIAATRNVHKTFFSGIAFTGMDVHWLYAKHSNHYLSSTLSPSELSEYLCSAQERPVAVYVTSPDYLGSMIDIQAFARVCHEYGVLLIVDNAHGAYLRFLPASIHPMDLGADLCCDSAHKTLPALTGAAYLHIAPHLPELFRENAKNAMALFGSTSPSYLILQSLDAVNVRLVADYPQRLQMFCQEVARCREVLEQQGYECYGNEPLKLTLGTKKYGYTGKELSEILRTKGIEAEFADPDYIVFMPTPETGTAGLQRLTEALCTVPRHSEIQVSPPLPAVGIPGMTAREALLSPCETVSVNESIGRILATPSVSCPPAVPVLACGERIDEHSLECFRYYGVQSVNVVI